MKSKVRWKRVSIAISIGVIGVAVGSKAYADYQWRQGVCVRYYPDGSEKLLYGSDCNLPSESDSIQEDERI